MSDQPTTDPVLDLYIKFEEYGYVVVGGESIGHFNGPRAAAEAAARRTFPKPSATTGARDAAKSSSRQHFKLTVIVPGHHYTAEAK